MPLSCHERIKITKQTSFEKKNSLVYSPPDRTFLYRNDLWKNHFTRVHKMFLSQGMNLTVFVFIVEVDEMLRCMLKENIILNRLRSRWKLYHQQKILSFFFICSEAIAGMFECRCAALTFSIDDLIRGRKVWMTKVHSHKLLPASLDAYNIFADKTEWIALRVIMITL